jgi:hypothetical protein
MDIIIIVIISQLVKVCFYRDRGWRNKIIIIIQKQWPIANSSFILSSLSIIGVAPIGRGRYLCDFSKIRYVMWLGVRMTSINT